MKTQNSNLGLLRRSSNFQKNLSDIRKFTTSGFNINKAIKDNLMDRSFMMNKSYKKNLSKGGN